MYELMSAAARLPSLYELKSAAFNSSAMPLFFHLSGLWKSGWRMKCATRSSTVG